MKRVYCLYRVSTAQQVDVVKDDIPMQRIACHDFAARMGWTILVEKEEKGISGFKVSAEKRDAIQELKEAALNKEFDVLLVFMFDRLGRIENETPFVLEWFADHGIEVWSVNEGQQKFDQHVDKLMNYIRYWQASGESLKTSIRTKTRLGQLTEEGHYTGGTVPYGYRAVDKGRVNKRNRTVLDLQIDEDEAEVIRLIFHKYVDEGYGAQRLSHAWQRAAELQGKIPLGRKYFLCPLRKPADADDQRQARVSRRWHSEIRTADAIPVPLQRPTSRRMRRTIRLWRHKARRYCGESDPHEVCRDRCRAGIRDSESPA